MNDVTARIERKGINFLAHLPGSVMIYDVDHLDTIDTPPPEGNWTPINHSTVIRAVERVFDILPGVEIKTRDICIAKEGMRVVGAWTFGYHGRADDDKIFNDPYGFSGAIAVINSHDKSSALSFAAGDHIFVCDNLSISSDKIVIRRKHTNLTEAEVGRLAMRGISQAFTVSQMHLVWHISLREIPVTNVQRKAIMFDGVTEYGVLPPSKLKALADAYDEERALRLEVDPENPKRADSMFTVHGAFTRVLRNSSSAEKAIDRSAALTTLITNQSIYLR